MLTAVVVFVAVIVIRLAQPVHHYAAHVRHQGWLSGVYAGHTAADDEAFAKWRHAAIQTATDFVGSGSWQEVAHPFLLSLVWRTDYAVKLVLGVPMWPDTGGSFATGAAGTYNGYYRGLASTLVSLGRADTVVRLGWEFNTPYFRWQVKTPADARGYAAQWRQVVGTMRSVAGQHFTFVWNPDLSDGGIDPALAYPGDRYVDDIGLDVYDRGLRAGETPAQRWHDLVNERFGLQWQADFANAHGKPIAFPEWGLVGDPGLPTAGGDDPLFITNMHAWFAAHRTAFEDYFDANTNGQSYAIDGNTFPKATAAYLRLFGTTS